MGDEKPRDVIINERGRIATGETCCNKRITGDTAIEYIAHPLAVNVTNIVLFETYFFLLLWSKEHLHYLG